MKQNWIKLVVSIVSCQLVGGIGAIFTSSAIPTWYVTLNKPFFSPPNWLFAPVWTLLYLAMGVAVYLIWQKNLSKEKVRLAIKFFLIQLGLNFLWSPVFFGLRSPVLGLINIVAMWLMIVLTMKKFASISKPAFYLLVPYLLWVSFATLLNTAIVFLN